MKNKKTIRIVNILLAVVLLVIFIVSVVDTKETRKDTNFSQENMMEHIEKLSENGPRSLFNKEANDKALEYIVSQIESWGVKEGDTTSSPSYMIQEYVGVDTEHEFQNFYLRNVIVHIPATAENRTNEAIMFMGHFDSVPMGQGSSDDGVACATMLEAIRYYLKEETGNTLPITNDLVFCFVNGEEFDLYGSRAFMNEFEGFDNVVERIKFGVNLESRGTDGTLIMFETAKNNYNTVKLFSKINESVFTCSIATMVYDTMPNSTDFSNFKEAYQGLNMANIGGGEDYHTQNDSPENVGKAYLSQQAQIVEAIIERLGRYDLDLLYDAEESAIFFSYLNITTAVYNHTTVVVLGILAIILLIANIVLSALYRKQKNLKNTAKAILATVIGFILTAGITYLFYYLFQLVAALFGVINIHMVGTITYSNIPIVMGIALTALAVSVTTTHFASKWLKIERRDMTRAFAYIHATFGIVLSFVLADASYLFIFSGLMLLINELLITLVKKRDMSEYHGELLATALYFPIAIPVIFLATSALGMTMAYVYGLVAALVLFAVGIAITPLCEKFSVRALIRKKDTKVSAFEGALHILAVAMVILLAVSLTKPNASVNLQGKQNIAKLPYDDALVYATNGDDVNEYRIYDLNAYSALKKYAPEDMKYSGEYYWASWDLPEITDLSPLSTSEGNVLNVKKNAEHSLVYLNFSDINAESFTIDDGKTTETYTFTEDDIYTITLHTEATVTLNGGSANVECTEVFIDYAHLIPEEYANDKEKLHFNLWLADEFELK